ncbi:type I-E CRISPR-associated protein Cse1/CasA [Actinoalloteichus fjordicus]|uniref:CRISPR type I-E/ECOLI-associated protein CasA/Cse1 n=1 Tax=Actinoalloteichus fjordicus TaxID=1612552 RepID=A0AAC9LEW0_9PSEU|nr:type I-E CRISPR-associated protein Cse1/CasA [Actinoalloteichus fjordicus]APU16653.1 CRISPR type I-E/ECOLI-associated protein CasA/Cse1 [Actinoalloteichus fjordicus]
MVDNRSTFNLTEQPWIPVRTGGTVRRIGLRELFEKAHEIEDLAVPIPPAAAALWRVLYAITAQITGLNTALNSSDPDVDGWMAARNAVLERGALSAELVAEHFTSNRSKFYLFHADRPWMQEPRLIEECLVASGVNKLVAGRPAGNNQVWFGHFSDVEPQPIPAGEAVLHLLVQLYYGPAGKCTARRIAGHAESNSTKGVLRSTTSFHPIGANLFESLVAGVPGPPANADASIDRCGWEQPLLDPLGPPPEPTWPGGLLTGRSRHAVLLVPDATGTLVTDAYLTWAWRAPSVEARDPYLVYDTSREGRAYPRPASSDRAVWRDLDSLLLRASVDSGAAPRRPALFDGLARLPSEVRDRLRLAAYGFDQDGQTRDRQWFSASIPPVLRHLEEHDPITAIHIGELRRAAEAVGRRLQHCLGDAWRDVTSAASREKDRGGPWPVRAAQHYWPSAEREFWSRLRTGDVDADPWVFQQLAHRAIDAALSPTDEADLRIARAVDLARRRLSRVLTKETR